MAALSNNFALVPASACPLADGRFWSYGAVLESPRPRAVGVCVEFYIFFNCRSLSRLLHEAPLLPGFVARSRHAGRTWHQCRSCIPAGAGSFTGRGNDSNRIFRCLVSGCPPRAEEIFVSDGPSQRAPANARRSRICGGTCGG